MPIYDMICDECEHTWGDIRKMSQGVRKTCPECKSRNVRQLFEKPPMGIVLGYSPMHPRRLRARKGRPYFQE